MLNSSIRSSGLNQTRELREVATFSFAVFFGSYLGLLVLELFMPGFVVRFINPSWMLWFASPFIFGSLLPSAVVRYQRNRYRLIFIVGLSLAVGVITYVSIKNALGSTAVLFCALSSLATASILWSIDYERHSKNSL